MKRQLKPRVFLISSSKTLHGFDVLAAWLIVGSLVGQPWTISQRSSTTSGYDRPPRIDRVVREAAYLTRGGEGRPAAATDFHQTTIRIDLSLLAIGIQISTYDEVCKSKEL